jgi:hypothetical protein
MEHALHRKRQDSETPETQPAKSDETKILTKNFNRIDEHL